MRVGVYTHNRERAEAIIKEVEGQLGGKLIITESYIYLIAENGDEWCWHKPGIYSYRVHKALVDRKFSNEELNKWVYPLFIGRPDPYPIEFFDWPDA